MRNIVKAVLACAVALPLSAAATEHGTVGSAPIVVELFTSQGCSSCPPADSFLAELAERDGVLALGFHVDYWDYLGWKDPFSSTEVSQRQRDYAAIMGGRYVYTPQMVIQGSSQAVGSEKRSVEARIAEARKAPRVDLHLVYDRAAETVMLTVPSSTTKESHALWLVLYDDEQTTKIPKGENAGKTIKYAHVVRDLRRIDDWQGEAREITLALSDLTTDASAAYACAVLLQSQETGHILGAANLELPAKK
jgi:hypothetical protein